MNQTDDDGMPGMPASQRPDGRAHCENGELAGSLGRSWKAGDWTFTRAPA